MRENFRVSKQTFLYICERLFHILKPQENAFMPTLSVEKIVAVALFKLASCAEYRTVGISFGIHKSTVKKCLYRVCDAICKVLMSEEIRMPDEQEAQVLSRKFERKCKFLSVIGCIDGSHIPVTAPAEGKRDFLNRKGWASLVLQGVVDVNYLFRDISIKYPGSSHDALVFKNSFIFRNNPRLIPQNTVNINGMAISSMLIGDPAYPLLPWLIKGYSPPRSPEESSFNTYISSARIVVENAFGRLKGRFRCLTKRLDVHHSFIPTLVGACCVLHNLVERNNEHYYNHWDLDREELENIYPQPIRIPIQDPHEANVIRNHLKEYLANTQPLRVPNRPF